MKIQEAISIAMQMQISELDKILITRENQRQFCGAMVFGTHDETGELIIRDWESDPPCQIAKLFLTDIMADDWCIEPRERATNQPTPKPEVSE